MIEIMFQEKIDSQFALDLVEKYDLSLILDSFQSTEASRVSQEMQHRNTYPFSELIFVAGGSHASGDPLGTLRMGFDYVVVGEGEETLKQLLISLILNRDFKNIPEGVGRLLNGKNLDFKPNRRTVDLNNYQPYITHPRSLHPPIEIARGCPFGCRFCQVSYLFGYKPRYRSLETIDRIIRHYCRQFQKNVQIRLITPNFLGYGSKTGRKPNLRALMGLLEVIRSYPVDLFAGTFPSTVRPDFLNEETTRLLSQNAANNRISMGVQSGSQRILANICRRGHSLDIVTKSHEFLEEAGLKSTPDFIFGIPGETPSDQWETLDFMRFLIDMFDARPRIHHFLPLPGTPLAIYPPAPIDPEVWKGLCQLTSQELAEGHFTKQQRIISEFPFIKSEAKHPLSSSPKS